MERRHHPYEEERRPNLQSGGVEGGEHVQGHHDEQHHEKKSVMKKVKDKAKKIKDTITKHGHGHHGHEIEAHHDHIHATHRDHDMEDFDDEIEDNPEVHGAPIYESKEVRSNVPGQVVTSIQHDVMVAGAHPSTAAAVAAGHHGTSSIHDVPVPLGGAHRNTTPKTMRSHGTSLTQVHGVTATATPLAAVGHHGTGSIQPDAIPGGARGTGSAVGRHGTTSIQQDAMQEVAHGTTTVPLAFGHHGTKASDSNIGLSREVHDSKDYRSFIPEQVGVSKHDQGVTYGGSQTPHSVGGGATQLTGHSLGSAGAHDQTNLPFSSGMGMGGVFPQKTSILDQQTALVPDPHATTGDRQPHNHQSKAKDSTGKGCEEIGITPILHSLDKMTTYDDDIKQRNVKISTGQQEGLLDPNAGLVDKNWIQPLYSGTGSHDQSSPEPISYPPAQHGSDVSSATGMISDKAIQAKNAVASKLVYRGQQCEGDHQKTTANSHSYERGVEADKTSSPSSMTDYGEKVASTVYEKVAGAGGAVMAKMPGSQTETHEPEPEPEVVYDKGVSTKEYITEKVSPGEEDKALSEVISGALHNGREKEEDDLEDEKKAEPRGKVTFSAKVVRQLGGEEEAHESVEDLGSGVSGPAGGGAMVDKLRDTFTSWLGIGGETDEQSTLVWHDIPKDANEADQQDKGRRT